jgi:hypothetical protein
MLSPRLLEFIRTCIGSVWTIDLLLMMRRVPERIWDAQQLIAELRSSRSVVAESLDCLMKAGLVREPTPGGYRYDPAPGLEGICQELEAEYQLRPARVINAVASGKRSGIQTLADAFRIRDQES